MKVFPPKTTPSQAVGNRPGLGRDVNGRHHHLALRKSRVIRTVAKPVGKCKTHDPLDEPPLADYWFGSLNRRSVRRSRYLFGVRFTGWSDGASWAEKRFAELMAADRFTQSAMSDSRSKSTSQV